MSSNLDFDFINIDVILMLQGHGILMTTLKLFSKSNTTNQGAGVHAFIIGKICTEKYVIMLLKKPKYARKIQNMHYKIIV